MSVEGLGWQALWQVKPHVESGEISLRITADRPEADIAFCVLRSDDNGRLSLPRLRDHRLSRPSLGSMQSPGQLTS